MADNVQLNELLKSAVDMGAADVFVVAGLPITFKVNEKFIAYNEQKMLPAATREIITSMYESSERSMDHLMRTGDDDFSVSIPGLSRFRVNTYKQRGSLAAIIRVIRFEIPDYRKYNIPVEIIKIPSRVPKGLILVTGPAGSGKSTTLACMIDEINKTRSGHIITIENPIEYIHRNQKCIISQREIESDTETYATALKASLRQSPDVILVGEMRDFETIQFVMTAAETGHLVISTLHTVGAVNTIDRIIDVFPPNQQQQIRIQISMLLQSVISQQLLPSTSGSLVPAFEIMHINSAIRNMIRDAKIHQIDTVIFGGTKEGMMSMDTSLIELYKTKMISRETALNFSLNPEIVEKRLNLP